MQMPPGPQSKSRTIHMPLSKLIPIVKIPKIILKHELAMDSSLRTLKNSQITLPIKKSIKPRPNDLKFCTLVTFNITELFQLLEFFSDP